MFLLIFYFFHLSYFYIIFSVIFRTDKKYSKWTSNINSKTEGNNCLIVFFSFLAAFSWRISWNRLLDFNCSWPGKAHDARVFNHSPLREDLTELCHVPDRHLVETYHILGDSAYPLSNHLISPYRVKSNMSLAQKKFNTNLASKHSVIERAFGLMGQSFPRLLKTEGEVIGQKNFVHCELMCITQLVHNGKWCWWRCIWRTDKQLGLSCAPI